MQHRSEGPDPPELWTCADVERWLKAAFKAMPYVPIYAPRGETPTSANRTRPDPSFDIIAFTGTVLGHKTRERFILPVWARAVATEGAVGGSISQYCDRNRIRRRTFDRQRIRACERVVAAKNLLDARG